MRLQRRRETHGSVNQAGTLPAPFPVGRSPSRLGSERPGQRLPHLPSEPSPSSVGGAGVWAAGPGESLCTDRQVDTVQSKQPVWRSRPRRSRLDPHDTSS